MNRLIYLGLGVTVAIIVAVVGLVLLLQEDDEKDDGISQIAMVVHMDVTEVGVDQTANSIIVPLKRQLSDLGHVEGENTQYVMVTGDTPENLAASAEAVADQEFDLILVFGLAEFDAARAAGLQGPLLFYMNRLAISRNVSAALADPSSNTTGAVLPLYAPKRLELLMEMVPTINRIYMPYNPDNIFSTASIEAITGMQDEFGIEIVTVEFHDSASFMQALADMPDDIDAIFLFSEPEVAMGLAAWSTAGLQRRIPVSIGFGIPLGEVLMGYGSDITSVHAILARQADMILRGKNPNDLPLETVESAMFIHLGVADAIGLDIPDSALQRADEIIRDEVSVPSLADANVAVDTEGACNTTLSSPFGDFAICVTQSCASLQDEAPVLFLDKVDVDACSEESLVGTCAAETGTSYFYAGEADFVAGLCAMSNGTWTIADSD